jgi:hypothetical protein
VGVWTRALTAGELRFLQDAGEQTIETLIVRHGHLPGGDSEDVTDQG